MKMRRGINQMRMNLGPGQTARIKYRVRCPLRGHYTIGPISVRYRNSFNLYVNESQIEDRTDVTVFPQVREIEEALLRSDVPKMYTGATTLKTPGQGMEFYSLREYLPGDAFRSINWKAYAKTGDLMVNEKTRDAVTDVFIFLDTRDVSRIGTVLKNPLEMGTVAAASVSTTRHGGPARFCTQLTMSAACRPPLYGAGAVALANAPLSRPLTPSRTKASQRPCVGRAANPAR